MADIVSGTSPGIRRPADWEALHALECLLPPSPSVSFNDGLGSEFDFSNIPIVLDHGLQIDMGETVEAADDSELPSLLNLIVPSVSIETCGTFGRHSYHALTIDIQRANMATASPSMELLSPTSIQFSLKDSDVNRTSVMSRFTVSAYLAPEMQARKRYLSASGSDWTLPASPTNCGSSPPVSPTIQRLKSEEGTPSSRPSSPMLKYSALKSLSSASSTIISAIASPPSPSPSAPSLEPQMDWAAAISAIPTRTARWFPPELPVMHSPEKSPQIKSNSDIRDVQSCSRSPTLATKIPPTPATSPTRKCAGSPQRTLDASLRPATSFCVKVKQLPEALSWLQYLDLEFWIDQEYRILPDKKHTRSTMRLMGYTAPDSSIPVNQVDLMTDALAEFKPAIRKTFAFHNHPTADYLPILKRAVILNDDPKDCVSRQALITLRTNGVYSISGTETYDLTPSTAGHFGLPVSKDPHPKLKWRFEYLVTDHRDANNDIVPDLKSMTPLSFTCSPGLLHPLHGKKYRGMFDLFRQSLLPKITSERVHAPTPPKDAIKPYGQLSQARHVPSNPVVSTRKTSPGIVRNIMRDGIQSVPSIDSGSKHRRYHSSSAGVQLENGQEYRRGDGSGIPNVSMTRRPMRVRAASVAALGDVTNVGRQQPGSRNVPKGKYPAMDERRRSVTAPNFKPVRYIVPPTELDNLVVSSIPEAEDTPSGLGITSLKPPAYHIRHRRIPPAQILAS